MWCFATHLLVCLGKSVRFYNETEIHLGDTQVFFVD